jgi:hypothetical protein
MNNFSTTNSIINTENNTSKFNHTKENFKPYYEESRLFSETSSKTNKKRKDSFLNFSIDNFKTNGKFLSLIS